MAGKLFAACDRGDLTLVVLPEVLAECVFVLESFYKQPRGGIARALAILIASRGIDIDAVSIHLDALRRYARTRLHFIDCTIAASAAATGMSVASLDTGFRKLPDVRVELDD